MASEEYGEVGFTSADRRLLITIAAKFDSFKETSERRLDLLESQRAHKDDMLRIERDIREELKDKAHRSEVPVATVASLEKLVDKLNSRIEKLSVKVTWAYAFGAGGAAACSVVTYLLTAYFKH